MHFFLYVKYPLAVSSGLPFDIQAFSRSSLRLTVTIQT